MLARGLHRLRGLVHVHFHDWELVDRPRAVALEILLRALRVRRTPVAITELARVAADGPLQPWPTIAA
jgi:hypothetical protein